MDYKSKEGIKLINKKQYKGYNLGVEILRVFLSFMVIMEYLYNILSYSHIFFNIIFFYI